MNHKNNHFAEIYLDFFATIYCVILSYWSGVINKDVSVFTFIAFPTTSECTAHGCNLKTNGDLQFKKKKILFKRGTGGANM